jgi:signal transduction histidine kinase/ActR/RegA family two-component response regulator
MSESKVTDLACLLRERRDQVVACFVREVQRQDLPPGATHKSLLVDHIPSFLDEIVGELEREQKLRASADVIATSPTAQQHGGQRWSLGYDLDAVIREYGVLRHCIFEVALETGNEVSIAQADVLAKCLNVGVAEAATAYARHRDEQLQAETARRSFLIDAGELLSSSLDYRSTLTHLTQLIVPQCADWCAIHLEGCPVEEMPLAHVDPTKVEVLRAIYERYPLPSDSRFSAKEVMRQGSPVIMSAADPALIASLAQSAEHLAMLQAIGSRSWMIVPLGVQGFVFGAITFVYSDSGRSYGPADLTLAQELARRAAVAVDNARLYQRSQEERARVEAATRAKDEFVAMVSHELRTPMNAILGWLHLLRSSTLSADKQTRALEIIERNATAQNALIADLLSMTEMLTGKLRINPAQVDVTNLVEMAIEGVRPAADAKRIRLAAQLDSSNTVIRADGERLQQVVWNLLTNAVKFTPKDGLISVQLRRVASDIELTVQDDGEGIDPDFIPHMFESFRQYDTSFSRRYGGLGIGLSIARHIVELHGGSIEGKSPGRGQGATFVVRIPVSPLFSTARGVSVVVNAEGAFKKTTRPQLSGVRILIVDDDPGAQELLRYVLEDCGIEVKTASSAVQARDVLETYVPHLIISDLGMPEEDGNQLIRRLRSSPLEHIRSIPAIALTAAVRNEDRTGALVAGFNRCIAKPVEVDALLEIITELTAARARPPST